MSRGRDQKLFLGLTRYFWISQVGLAILVTGSMTRHWWLYAVGFSIFAMSDWRRTVWTNRQASIFSGSSEPDPAD